MLNHHGQGEGRGRKQLCDMESYVYHYTSLEAFKGIIGEKDICLWATKYDCLNDPLEQKWAQQIVFDKIRKLEDYKTMDEKEIAAFHAKYPYTISLCKDCDSRVMWRLYAGDGKGIMLVFKAKVLMKTAREHTFKDPKNSYEIFAPVVYANDKNVSECIHSSMKQIAYPELNDEKPNMLAQTCSFIKHEDFRCEKEVRYAVSREFDNIKISYNKVKQCSEVSDVSENISDVKYRMRSNELIPYLEVHLPICSLEKVVVGYQMREPNSVCQRIRDYMRSRNELLYKDVKVELSKIKYDV